MFRTTLLAGAAMVLATAGVPGAARASIVPTYTYNYTGALQTQTITTAGTYAVVAFGAQGGAAQSPVSSTAGGLGAEVGGAFVFKAGDVVSILVGQQGLSARSGGGGGGSFVVANGLNVIAAGGGGSVLGDAGTGGSASSAAHAGNSSGGAAGAPGDGGGGGGGGVGGGGGGYLNNGQDGSGGGGGGGLGYTAAGGLGFQGGGNGGFGGGGGGDSGELVAGGGGGGYTGGGGGGLFGGGGGGGSFTEGLTGADSVSLSGVQVGNGFVTINLVSAAAVTPPTDSTAVPEPATFAVLGVGLLGLAAVRRRV